MAKERRCPHCGKNTRTTGDFCPWCSKPMVITPDSENLVVLQTKEKKSIKKNIGGIVMKIKAWPWDKIICALIFLYLTATFVIFFQTLAYSSSWPGIVALCGLGFAMIGTFIYFLHENNEKLSKMVFKVGKWFIYIGAIAIAVSLIFGFLIPAFSVDSAETAKTAPTAGTTFSLGEPANAEDVKSSVWNEPLEDGVMVDAYGTTVYTQSGKDGSTLLKGQIPEGQALVLDSFTLFKKTNGVTESYSNGNLMVIVGPLDLNSNPIGYTDGAAQMVSVTSLQKFIDNNIALKFARGDWSAEKNQWSYQPWALTNFWLPDGYTYNDLDLTYDTDTYPNRDKATDMTVNTK